MTLIDYFQSLRQLFHNFIKNTGKCSKCTWVSRLCRCRCSNKFSAYSALTRSAKLSQNITFGNIMMFIPPQSIYNQTTTLFTLSEKRGDGSSPRSLRTILRRNGCMQAVLDQACLDTYVRSGRFSVKNALSLLTIQCFDDLQCAFQNNAIYDKHHWSMPDCDFLKQFTLCMLGFPVQFDGLSYSIVFLSLP